MQLHEAVRDAPNYLRNAQDVAQRSPANVDTLYMWDNQVAAIELFLAETEDLNGQNPDLSRMRKELYGLKKQIESKVLEFELKQENQEMPPEPTEEELVEDLTAYGKELQDLVKELSKIKFRARKDFEEVEEPLQQLAAFIVDTEPLRGKSAELDKYREAAKKCRNEVDAKTRDYLKELRAKEAEEPDDD